MAALQQVGYKCQVFDYYDLLGRKIQRHFKSKSLVALRKFGLDFLPRRTVFNLKRLLMSLAARHLFAKNDYILWTRDPLMALILNLTQKLPNTVIEVHQVPHFLDKIFMRIVSVKESVLLAPISLELKNRLLKSRLNFNAQSIILCPMGVPDEFFDAKTERVKFNKKSITITYVGGLKSNGFDQGIKEIIGFIRNFNNQSNEVHLNFHLYGISTPEESEIRKLFPHEINNYSIKCEPRQPHETLIPKLQKTDIFLLPYPEGVYFNARFPLKALEYAALARPIMVSDTPSHRNIFDEKEVWFFNQRSYENFVSTLKMLLDNEDIVAVKVALAYEKAENFTYRRRIEKILERFGTS